MTWPVPSLLLLVLFPTARLLSVVARSSSGEELNSREYKTLLRSGLFATEDVAGVLADLQRDLVRAAAATGATDSGGRFRLKEGSPRWVRYLDTPGGCQLRNRQYTLRMRRSPEEPWEVTLKTRNGDRYHSAVRGQSLKGCREGYGEGKHKFEEDVGRLDWTGSVFSFSQTCTMDWENEADRDSLQLIANVWGDMKHLMKKDLGMDTTTPLALVGNMTITEVAYEGFWIDLDDGDDDDLAEARITLWYHTDPNATTGSMGQPMVAELSFVIQSKHEAWSDKSIMNMHAFWDECATELNSKWLDPSSMTKTAWIYGYDPIFCHAEDSDGEAT